ncbi:MAG: 2,3,4,5-tetrahydropyridine-2,6-dicarboxylate N-succinyltransferase [Acidobacteria bacterium]|nr:2,3,4,5-tetrahydropyridine-2,6-dicarboxylate N-succinyltransferase [Acidobacteriota bacterium]
MQLEQEIERIYSLPDAEAQKEGRVVFNAFKDLLNKGQLRAAEPEDGNWRVRPWVKKGIMLGFRLGRITNMSINADFNFYDKDTYPLKYIDGMRDHIRVVPGGSSIRDGAYVAPRVVIMPPAYINVGAYVDEGAMIDSHALVGSCAQVGKRVHLSASAQLGGVLEPVGALPVIVEDDVLIGGNCGVYEGIIIRRQAILAAGTIVTGATPVYDLVRNKIYRKTADNPLIIPEGAVVVPGTRSLHRRDARPAESFAREHGLAVQTPIIIKYRDEKTETSVLLEEALR